MANFSSGETPSTEKIYYGFLALFTVAALVFSYYV